MRKLFVLMLFLTFAAARAQEKVGEPKVVTEDSKITLEMENSPIGSVLKLLAVQNHLNIVSGQDVRGSVSLRLSQVSLDEALSAILLSNGYTYSRQGDVIVVIPMEKDYPQQLESRVFELSYVSADYMMACLKDVLSPKGKIQTVSKDVRKIEAGKRSEERRVGKECRL